MIDDLKDQIARHRADLEVLERALAILEGHPVRMHALADPAVPVRMHAPRADTRPKATAPEGGAASEPFVTRVMRALRSGPKTAEELAATLGIQRKQVMMVFHNHGKRIQRTYQDGMKKLALTAAGAEEARSLPDSSN